MHQIVISEEMLKISITKLSLKITHLKLQSCLPMTNQWIPSDACVCVCVCLCKLGHWFGDEPTFKPMLTDC